MKKAAFMAFAMAGMLSGSVMAQDDGDIETEEVTEKNACSGECKDAADKEACMAKSSESSESNGCGENGCG